MRDPSFADALVVVAWALLITDVLRAARRAHMPAWRRLAAVALLTGMVVAGQRLEAVTGGRLAWHPAAAALGAAAVGLGLGLHFWARRTLAERWSSAVTPRPDAPLIEAGPYAHVRHPLYLAILLVGAGTVLTHCSRATLAGGLGLAVGTILKGRIEDRALEERFGERWHAYARRVPAFVPRISRGRP